VSSRAKKIIVAAVVLLGVSYYAYSSWQDEIARKAKMDADKAVSVLPFGTREAWISYVDRRLRAVIQPHRGSVRVIDNVGSVTANTTLVSSNTPYIVSCSPALGADLLPADVPEFG
jgi:hypothetical protein